MRSDNISRRRKKMEDSRGKCDSLSTAVEILVSVALLILSALIIAGIVLPRKHSPAVHLADMSKIHDTADAPDDLSPEKESAVLEGLSL